MAITSLSDVIIPRVFTQYLTEQVSVKSALVASGAIVQSDMLNEYAAGKGRVTDIPLFTQVSYSDPDVATDTATAATPAAVGTGQQIAQKDFLSKTWGQAELVSSVIGEDVIGHVVANHVAPYWAQAIQAYALAKLSGVIKDNLANNGGDMVSSPATDAVGALTVAEKFNIDTFVEARQTMGDAADRLSLIVMHSRIFANLLKLEPTNCERASATVPFDSYMGMRVLIDDSMPSSAGTNRTTYTSYLLGQGAFLMGDADLGERSVAIETNETQGKGWGTSTLTSRKQMILHPQGFASSATITAANGSPTLAQYDAASAWDRVLARKNCPIVAFETNA